MDGSPSEVNALARTLSDTTGMLWRGVHRGSGEAVPDAAMLAGFARNDAGRWVLAGVMLLGDAVTADMLRKVPVAALENGMNQSSEAGHELLNKTIAALPTLERRQDTSAEDFSRLVAEHYRAWAGVVPHPAAAMAARAGVKSPTMHTWIREARLRGFLPPARRGKGAAGYPDQGGPAGPSA